MSETPNTSVTFRLPADLLARLRAIRAEEGITLTAQVTHALRAYLDQADDDARLAEHFQEYLRPSVTRPFWWIDPRSGGVQ